MDTGTNHHADGESTGRGAGTSPAGRILKVKRGYNPNSSSMGSELEACYAFPRVMMAVPVIFAAAAAAVAAALGREREAKPRADTDRSRLETGPEGEGSSG